MNMSQDTEYAIRPLVQQNWTPLLLELQDQTTMTSDAADGPPQTAAQLNGDGTLYVDWAVVERLAALVPLVPGGQCQIAHLLLAMRNGRFADAPRDFSYPPTIRMDTPT